jgi:hypothetical protein
MCRSRVRPPRGGKRAKGARGRDGPAAIGGQRQQRRGPLRRRGRFLRRKARSHKEEPQMKGEEPKPAKRQAETGRQRQVDLESLGRWTREPNWRGVNVVRTAQKIAGHQVHAAWRVKQEIWVCAGTWQQEAKGVGRMRARGSVCSGGRLRERRRAENQFLNSSKFTPSPRTVPGTVAHANAVSMMLTVVRAVPGDTATRTACTGPGPFAHCTAVSWVGQQGFG